MATAASVCRTARQAKRAGPKLEAGPEASADRREGTIEARMGRNPAGGSMRSTRARPAISQGAGDAHMTSTKSQWAATVHGIGTMVSAMDLRELQDDDLLAYAREWRQRALRGEKEARGLAHELECEVRRRFPRNDAPQTLPPIHLLGAVPQPAQRRWKPW